MTEEEPQTLSTSADYLKFLTWRKKDIAERIKVARELLSSPQLVIPRKHHVLLDWVITTLHKSHSYYTDPVVALKEGGEIELLDADLWEFFVFLLESHELRQQASIPPGIIHTVSSVFKHLQYRESTGAHQANYDLLAQHVEQAFNIIFLRYSSFVRPTYIKFAELVTSLSYLVLNVVASQETSAENQQLSPVASSFIGVLITALKIFRQMILDHSTPGATYSTVTESLLEPFLYLRYFASLRLSRADASTPLASQDFLKLRQVTAQIEKTLQQGLFSQTVFSHFQQAYAPSIKYGNDPFYWKQAEVMESKAERGAPNAKRAKHGKKDDLSAKYDSNAGFASKSYPRKMVDQLDKLLFADKPAPSAQPTEKGAKQGDDQKMHLVSLDKTLTAEILLKSLPFLYRLCLSAVTSSSSAAAEVGTTTTSSKKTSSAMDVEETASNNYALVSDQTKSTLWLVFAGFQWVVMKKAFSESTSAANLSHSLESNSQLLSLVREYDIYSFAVAEQGIRTNYLQNHVSHLLSLLQQHPALDPVFGSLRGALLLDQTLFDGHLPTLLRTIWAQPSFLQNDMDSFAASLLDVYSTLRQMDVLLVDLLQEIRKANIVGFFGPRFWTSLNSAFESLPPGLILPIYNIFITDLKNNYIHFADISPNVIHAEAMFNHFLESIRLSPVLATQLCDALVRSVSDICGPLLLAFLEDVDQYATSEDDKRKKKIVEKFGKANGIPNSVQAGLALYHIFVTFETYCKNRFFPSHNTPEDVDLRDELKPTFSKLESSSTLDQVWKLIQAVEKHMTKQEQKKTKKSTEDVARDWRFKSILFTSIVHRAVQLYNLTEAEPAANLPSLVRRHDQVEALKKSSKIELKILLKRLESVFDGMTSYLSNHEVDKEVLRAEVDSSWQVEDEASYFAFVWKSISSHLVLVASPYAPPTLCRNLIRQLVLFHVQLQREQSNHAHQLSLQSQMLSTASLTCWTSASFYEIPVARSLIVPVTIAEIAAIMKKALESAKKVDQSLVDSIDNTEASNMSSIIKNLLGKDNIRQQTYSIDNDALSSLFKVLESLPETVWALSDMKAAIAPLFCYLCIATQLGFPNDAIMVLLTGLRIVLGRSLSSPSLRSCLPQLLVLISECLSASDVLQLATSLKTRIDMKAASLLTRLGDLFALSNETKGLKKLFSAVKSHFKELSKEDSADDSDLDWALAQMQALLEGVIAAYQRLEDEATLHFDWTRYNQRNIVGYKTPALKKINFPASLDESMGVAAKIIEEHVSKRSSGSDLRSALLLRSHFSLIEYHRLQSSRFACRESEEGTSVHIREGQQFPLPSDLQISLYLDFLGSQIAPSKVSSETAMDVDAAPVEADTSEVKQFAFSAFYALARSLPCLGDKISQNQLRQMCAVLYRMLSQDEYSRTGEDMLGAVIPQLATSQATLMLSFFVSELIALTVKEKTILTVAPYQGLTLKQVAERKDSVRKLLATISAIHLMLSLMSTTIAFTTLSSTGANLVTLLCGLVESAWWPSLQAPLEENLHEKLLSLITLLLSERFVEISGSGLNSALGLLGVTLAKYHTLQAAPLLLQNVSTSDPNLTVPLSVWSDMAESLFSPGVFTAYFRLCHTYLHSRAKQAHKNIATLILNAKVLLYAVTIHSRPSSEAHRHSNINGRSIVKNYTPLQRIHAEYVGRLLAELANLGSFMRSYAAPLLVDIIELFEKESVLPIIRQALSNGIYSLVDLLTENEQNQILKAVDATGKTIFRQFFQEYQRDFKYTGKA